MPERWGCAPLGPSSVLSRPRRGLHPSSAHTHTHGAHTPGSLLGGAQAPTPQLKANRSSDLLHPSAIWVENGQRGLLCNFLLWCLRPRRQDAGCCWVAATWKPREESMSPMPEWMGAPCRPRHCRGASTHPEDEPVVCSRPGSPSSEGMSPLPWGTGRTDHCTDPSCRGGRHFLPGSPGWREPQAWALLTATSAY